MAKQRWEPVTNDGNEKTERLWVGEAGGWLYRSVVPTKSTVAIGLTFVPANNGVQVWPATDAASPVPAPQPSEATARADHECS